MSQPCLARHNGHWEDHDDVKIVVGSQNLGAKVAAWQTAPELCGQISQPPILLLCLVRLDKAVLCAHVRALMRDVKRQTVHDSLGFLPHLPLPRPQSCLLSIQ